MIQRRDFSEPDDDDDDRAYLRELESGEHDDDASLDEDFPLGDGTADTTGTVHCPYCGEANEIALDPGSGATQHYVEDCQVCCRPWRVHVTYDDEGAATVEVEAADE